MSYRLQFDPRYGFAVGRIRVLEKRLFTGQLLDRMIQTSQADEAGRILAEAGYSKGGESASFHSWKQIENAIDQEWVSALDMICQLSRDLVWTDLFRKRVDFHNLRAVFREEGTGGAEGGFLRTGGLFEVEAMRDAVRTEKEVPLPAFIRPAVDFIRQSSGEKKDFQEVDSMIDRFEVREWQRILGQYPNDFLKLWRMQESDLLNLRTFFRLRVFQFPKSLLEGAVVEGGSFEPEWYSEFFAEPWDNVLRDLNRTLYGELAAEAVRQIDAGRPFFGWEQKCQEIRSRFIQPARSHGFGVEVLFAYLIFKEIELYTVRRVAVGHANDLPKEFIREGLPENAFV